MAVNQCRLKVHSHLFIVRSLNIGDVSGLVSEESRAELLHPVGVLHLQRHSRFQVLPNILE